MPRKYQDPNVSRHWDPAASVPHALLSPNPPVLATLGWRAGWASSSGHSNAGSGREGSAALITPALQAPICSQKDSRDTAFNNYH